MLFNKSLITEKKNHLKISTVIKLNTKTPTYFFYLMRYFISTSLVNRFNNEKLVLKSYEIDCHNEGSDFRIENINNLKNYKRFIII